MKKIANLLLGAIFFVSLGVFAQNLTLGKIQQTVQKGVTKEKILEDLGSPNMVTGSSADQETWIYDKVSTTVQSEAKSEGTAVIGGVFGGVFGVGGKSSSENISSTRTTSQRTLTLIIKFKGENVESFATRMSNF
jgi:hypothetical protein